MDDTAAAYDADHDDDWLDWIDDDDAVDRLLHDVVETLEHDESLRAGRRERPDPADGARPRKDPESRRAS
jgi:hypothetical protein